MQREDFSRWFQQAVEESRSACIMEQCEHNRIYLQFQEDYRQAMEKIEEKLGADRALLRPMEEALNAMGGMEYDWMTRQAFRDCMYLLRYMDAFSLPEWEVEARA